MQQTVWNVHKEMDNIGVMESVNGKLTNVNSNKVLITKNIMGQSHDLHNLGLKNA